MIIRYYLNIVFLNKLGEKMKFVGAHVSASGGVFNAPKMLLKLVQKLLHFLQKIKDSGAQKLLIIKR